MKAPDVAEELLAGSPFSLRGAEKQQALLPALDALTRHHYEKSPEYRRVVDAIFGGLKREAYAALEELPFVPVSLFKSHESVSVPREAVFRVLTSSGTSEQAV